MSAEAEKSKRCYLDSPNASLIPNLLKENAIKDLGLLEDMGWVASQWNDLTLNVVDLVVVRGKEIQKTLKRKE